MDGYTSTVVVYTGENAVGYVTLNEAEEKVLDGGYEDDTNSSSPTMDRLLFDKYSETLTINGQAVGTLYLNKFSPSPEIAGARLKWSAVSDFTSFDGSNVPINGNIYINGEINKGDKTIKYI